MDSTWQCQKSRRQKQKQIQIEKKICRDCDSLLCLPKSCNVICTSDFQNRFLENKNIVCSFGQDSCHRNHCQDLMEIQYHYILFSCKKIGDAYAYLGKIENIIIPPPKLTFQITILGYRQTESDSLWLHRFSTSQIIEMKDIGYFKFRSPKICI